MGLSVHHPRLQGGAAISDDHARDLSTHQTTIRIFEEYQEALPPVAANTLVANCPSNNPDWEAHLSCDWAAMVMETECLTRGDFGAQTLMSQPDL